MTCLLCVCLFVFFLCLVLVSRRKGQQLEPSEQYMFNKLDGGRSMLTIRNIRQGDGGAYACRATNKAGSQERELFLKVFGKADVALSTRTCREICGNDVYFGEY